ncbi:glyoxal reductase [Bifidobacterium dolichotidis]|uniref:Glyoxal reductase n=1 Tax=Bifidobacterium dolichotidis TaxID=2306976 RepID=A0A430FTI5_9BIFI|nr:aldo/keto reductase [Bifidobacterium dolichotidis]RSX56171.1 glyoxal reductase [Bifidobacterium dolichotidis]
MAFEEHVVTLNNDVQIPEIGFGVFQTKQGGTTVEAVKTALDCGYRHIDTAMIYGNEHDVADGIRNSGLDRSDVFVTTKLWNDDIRAGKTKEAFERSLKTMEFDYVDMYLIHWPADGWQQAWDEMQELYSEGRVKAIGVCNFEMDQLEELLKHSSIKPVVNQIESSPQFPNQELVDYTHEQGIAVEAWSPLGGLNTKLLSNQKLIDIGMKYGKSSSQVIVRWHMQRGVIPLPKSTSASHIAQNIDVFDFELTPEEMHEVSNLCINKRVGVSGHDFDF